METGLGKERWAKHVYAEEVIGSQEMSRKPKTSQAGSSLDG